MRKKTHYYHSYVDPITTKFRFGCVCKTTSRKGSYVIGVDDWARVTCKKCLELKRHYDEN